MRGKSVLIASSDPATRRRIGAPLRSAGSDVVHVERTDQAVDLLRAQAVDLALLDHDSMSGQAALLEAAADRVPVIVLSSKPDSSTLVELVCNHGVQNLLARRPGTGDRLALDPYEVLVTAEKIFREEIFGLDKYLPGFGVELRSMILTRADDRDVAVERILEFLRGLEVGRQMLSTIGVVADELITNAIYNAPRDDSGQPLYASTCRREKITLAPREYVRVQFGCNGQRFALAVNDKFGALTGDHLRSGLRRCLSNEDQIEQKAGGAGLGLYMVLTSCSQLVINLEPGTRTEVIAGWDLEKRLRGIRAGGHSLHVFVAGGGAGADETAVPEPSIALSESARHEVRAVVAGGRPEPEEPPAHPLRRSRPAGSRNLGQPVAAADDTELDGVLLLRRASQPGLDTSLAALRGSARVSDVLQTLLTYVCSRWTGAILFRREQDQLRAWCAAGDLDDWERAQELSIDVTGAGSAAYLGRTAGVTIGPLSRKPGDVDIAAAILGTTNAEALGISIPIDLDVRYVIIGCRERSSFVEDRQPYERLLAEVAERLARLCGAEAVAPALPSARVVSRRGWRAAR